MSSIQTFSRLALKQFCALLEGVAVTESSTGDLESAIWEKIQAGNPGETIRVPYPLIKKSLRKAKLELPYMPGVINYNIGCQALKVTGGLYLPCCGKCDEEDMMGIPNEYCALCTKHGLKYGVMADRGDVGTYSDPTDKHEISFGTWLAKNEKTVEEVQAALLEEGFVLTIPSHYLTVNSKRITKEVKARKGRPKAAKKEVTGDDSDSGSSSESEEKTKKAPKKAPKKAKSSDGESDEEKPKKEKKAPKKAKSSDGESDGEKPKKKEKKAKSPKNSDEESDGEKPEKKEKKAKKVKAIEPEPEAEKKEKKVKSPKSKPEEPETKEPEPEKKKKEKKPKSPKNSDGESDGEKVEKKEKKEKKSKSKTDEPKKEKKEKSKNEKPVSTDMSSRFSGESTELAVEEYEPSGFDSRAESFGEGAEEIFIKGTKYMLREGTHIADIITGHIVGTMDDDGEAHLNGDEDF